MAPHDDEDTTPRNSVSAMTRRELLKELSKTPAMGVLLVPTAWATPLMEFAQVGAAPVLSSSEGRRQGCEGAGVSVPFAVNDTAGFYINWFGVSGSSNAYSGGYYCSVTLTRATGKAQLLVDRSFSIGLVSGPAIVSSTTTVDWSISPTGSPKITVAMIAPHRNYGNVIDGQFGDGTNSHVVDLQITGGGSNLEVSRFESRQCPYT